MARPVILDCDGPRMSNEEKALFKDLDPFGFILFTRNCQSPDQVRNLTDDMREAVGREDVPILIDQEGGRVCRLNQQHWRTPPSAESLRNLYDEDPDKGLMATKLNARLMAEELRILGITVDCYPLLDLKLPGADQIIGDRSFGAEPEIVISLAEAACEGLSSGGIVPIIKHIPGHGRASVDSHKALPVVDTDFETLMATDFAPFKALNHMPLAMTAHITYSSVDPNHSATLSEKLIRRIIRETIGFKGVLISDDVSMKALKGTAAENAKAALRAGCDIVLHCNASLEERRSVLDALYDFNIVNENWVVGLFKNRQNVTEIDKNELYAWLDNTLKH